MHGGYTKRFCVIFSTVFFFFFLMSRIFCNKEVSDPQNTSHDGRIKNNVFPINQLNQYQQRKQNDYNYNQYIQNQNWQKPRYIDDNQ